MFQCFFMFLRKGKKWKAKQNKNKNWKFRFVILRLSKTKNIEHALTFWRGFENAKSYFANFEIIHFISLKTLISKPKFVQVIKNGIWNCESIFKQNRSFRIEQILLILNTRVISLLFKIKICLRFISKLSCFKHFHSLSLPFKEKTHLRICFRTPKISDQQDFP